MDNNRYKRIGIIAALECELNILKDNLSSTVTKKIAGTTAYIGTIGNYEVVLMLCGMGKVSAASSTQAMITAFEPDCVINTGCAGALAAKLRLGDVVIATETAEWDLDTIDIGNPRGYVSALDRVRMTADETLSRGLTDVFAKKEKVHSGLIVSGDQFVDKSAQRVLILDAFPDALCTEMEGAAVGHVCAGNGVPFCVVRCMSDGANSDSTMSFAEFAELAGHKSAEYLLEFLRH